MRLKTLRTRAREFLIGESLRRICDLIDRQAAGDTTALVLGPHGSGKELAARALHECGPRHGRPFVAVNCAELTETLLESELFGHEKNAFTGADARRIGAFEQAADGTIFLDEVSEMSTAMQAKLLRTLQDDGDYKRVGGDVRIKRRCRVVCATNADLAALVKQGRFRADLFQRIRVTLIELPPLDARPSDIPALAAHFLALLGRAITPEALARLTARDWPGNVRELRNAIHAGADACTGTIGEKHLPSWVFRTREPRPEAAAPAPRRRRNGDTTRIVLEALAESDGNIGYAARKAGISPGHVWRIQREQRRAEEAEA